MTRAASPSPRSAEFKAEIQGLRAIGALLVATFHIWVGKVSGGVDVFFVVSGYLILGSLMKQAEKTGGIDLVGFAYRLSKRLLPAALFVIVAILIGTWLWLPQTRWEFVIKEAVASTLYLENWKLIRQSVDYLAREELPSPFQHYWAISIQGQFYVVFGIGLAIYLFVARRLVARAAKPVLPIAIVFLGSLAYSVWLTEVDQPTAYFSTFTRLWEFALGGLLAAALPRLMLGRLTLGRATRLMLGWIGFAAVLSCGAVLQVATLFPGYAALWPTLGACCVIAAGRPGSAFGADTILASRPLAYVGEISYSLYLWHWPVLIFYRAIFNEVDVGLGGGLAVLGLSLALSAATQRWVEQPFINLERSTPNPWPWLLKAAGIAAATLLVAGAFYGHVTMTKRAALAMPLDPSTHPGALAFPEAGTSPTAPIRPDALSARDDKPVAYDDGCHQSLGGTSVLTCVYGDKDAATTIALVGGSHSLMWLPAFQDIAARRDLRIVTMTKSGCLFSREYVDGPDGFEASCVDWNQRALAKLQELKPDAVFTTATRGHGEDERVPQGYVDAWRALDETGIAVFAIRDTPWIMLDAAECIEIEGVGAAACARARREMLAAASPMQAVAELPRNVHYLDLSRYFCTDETCPPVAGNVLIYSDRHHITATYAQTLGGILEAQIYAVLDRTQTAVTPPPATPG